jgi:folate-binding protein YgfZ
MPRELPLIDLHLAAGAVLGEVDGWRVPLRYGDAAVEHRTAREGVAIFDRSALGKAEVTGRDRAAFLQGMLTNDVKGLAPGQGCAAAFLDAHGRVMALLVVYALADRLWLELPSGLTEKTLQGLDHFLISEKAEFEAADERFAVIGAEGPGARALLEGLTGQPVDLTVHGHVEASIAGAPVRLIRRDEVGAPGFHCWTAPAHAPAVWQALRGAGAAPAGHEALEVLRIEAGVPAYGRDVDETVIMPETRLEALVNYTKGCYIGQETVARVKYRGHVNRALSGLTLEGQHVPAPGARVMAEDKDVGRITSAAWSPTLGAPVALGYVRREHFEPGSAVTVLDGDASFPARVTALPFVPPSDQS